MKQIMPQEIEVYYVIPAIRSFLASEMIKCGLKQKDAAEKLGTTASAISQYTKEKRGKKFNLSKFKDELKIGAKKIIDGESSRKIIQELCNTIRIKGGLCAIHKNLEKISEVCVICKK